VKQRLFGWISTFIGFVLALATIEVVAIVWLTLEEGRYSTASELFERSQNTYVRDVTRGSSCRYVDTLYPHPYLGFVHHGNAPCGLAAANNIGLLGEDFPTLRRADRFTVLLTGGSVAGQLGQIGPPPAPRYLEDELNRRYVSPNGKPFLVLNGGAGAWKQPQQLILFALYATAVDAVVTLDGFNEFYFFRPVAQDRLERPANNFLDVNPFVADENFGDAAVGWVAGRVAGALAAQPVLGQSHAAYMTVRGIEQLAKGRDITTARAKKTTLEGMFRLPPEVRGDADAIFAVQLDLYRKYARSMEAIARAQGVKAAYFLQPAPAFGKVLTDEERRAVGDLSYRDLYRKIVAGMLSLRDEGLAIHDLGEVFRAEAGPIYEDHIHFLQSSGGVSRGNSLVAAAIADRVAEAWSLARRPN